MTRSIRGLQCEFIKTAQLANLLVEEIVKFLLLATLVYGALLLVGIVFWAWQNSKNKLYIRRGLPKALLEKFPPISKSDRLRAFKWGIPVFVLMLMYPLIYSSVSRTIFGDDFTSVLFINFVLLATYNVLDLLIIDWLIICLITPKFFVVPGTEGDPAYKDYGFHLRGAVKGFVFVALGSLVFSGIAELVFLVSGRL